MNSIKYQCVGVQCVLITRTLYLVNESNQDPIDYSAGVHSDFFFYSVKNKELCLPVFNAKRICRDKQKKNPPLYELYFIFWYDVYALNIVYAHLCTKRQLNVHEKLEQYELKNSRIISRGYAIKKKQKNALFNSLKTNLAMVFTIH